VDRQLIGSIAHCPKCGAMVEIKPRPVLPAKNAQAELAGPSDLAGPPLPTSEAERRLAVGDQSGIDSQALTQSSVTSADDLTAPPVAGGTAFQSGETSGVSVADGSLDGPAAHLPVDPSSVWQSASSRRTSQLALVVMLAVFGLVAATVGFIQFARSFTRTNSVAQNSTDPAVLSVAEQPLVPEPDASEPNAEPNEIQSNESPPQSVETEVDTQPALPAVVDNDTDNDTLAASTPTTGVDAAAIPPAPGTGPAIGPAITAPPIASGGDAAMDDLPIGLRKFVPLLDVSTADNGAPQIFATPPTIDSVRLDAAAELETDDTPTVKRASIDIPKTLAMRFAIDNGGATLSELMLLVSQLTGVPIELELISIDLAGVSVNQPLQTPAGWMSIGQWLQQSLASAGLAMEVGDGIVLVHATTQRLLDTGGKALLLDDFGDDAEKLAAWLKPIVMPIVGPAVDVRGPDNEEENPQPTDEVGPADDAVKPAGPWSYDAAEKRLVVPADRFMLVQSICAAEAMRLISGKPTKLPRQQTARWVGRWTSVRQPDKAPGTITDWPLVNHGPAGVQLDSPRTVAGLLRRVATENRTGVAVVWHDVMRHQVYPTDLAMPLSDGLTVGAYLDEMIGEAGLQARDSGDSIWWIGSEGLYDRYEVITWMTIPPDTGDAIAKRLATTLGVPDPAQLPITWDQSTLMIRAPRYIARQLQRFIEP